MEINKKVVVVSGGASGLGEATCRLLVAKGAKVAIFDLDQKNAKRLLNRLGNKAIFIKTDVSNAENVQESVEKTVETFRTVDIAISCAGVIHASKVLAKKGPINMDIFNEVVQVNLNGTMNIIRSTSEQMLKNTPNSDGERGVIINTASGAAFEGQIGQVAYSASKAAVVGLTLPVAREFAEYGIRVMTIAPGLFETPMVYRLPDKVKNKLIAKRLFPRRLGKPSEYAMLCQQIIENSMLNGRIIRIDGAVTMQPK